MPDTILLLSGSGHILSRPIMAPGFFRTFHARFDASPLRNAFAPRKPRNALLRVLLGLVGIAVLAVLLVVGLAVGVLMLAFGLARRALGRRARQRPADARVVDAEYSVVGKSGQPLLR